MWRNESTTNECSSFCKLAKVMEDFLVNNGGTMDLAISIEIRGEYLKLKVNANIQLLDDLTGHLNTNAMDFFKAWLSHCCTLPKNFYITHSHLWDIVKN
jgi:hypothetical protein